MTDLLHRAIEALRRAKPSVLFETGMLEHQKFYQAASDMRDFAGEIDLLTIQYDAAQGAKSGEEYRWLKENKYTAQEEVKDTAIVEAIRFMESRNEEQGYGYYRPKNPHDFFPDRECCSPEEIAAHKAACNAFDNGAFVDDHADGWIAPGLHVTKAPWGIGAYTIRNEWADEILAKLRAAIAKSSQETGEAK